jgi:hypothetical protein
MILVGSDDQVVTVLRDEDRTIRVPRGTGILTPMRGEPGQTGPVGPQGQTGATGAQGERGPQGIPGESIQGERGEQGPVGERGPIGLTGEQGPVGERGPIGLTGPQGVPGEVSQAMLDAAVAQLVDNAPEALNTLDELANALGGDPDFATTVSTRIGEKADRVHTHTTHDITNLDAALAAIESVPAGGSSTTYLRGDRTWQRITKSDIGLAAVDNTADTDKPVSVAQADAIGAREPAIAGGTTTQWWRGDKTWQPISKATVGLSNVDNTADADKPISAPQAMYMSSREPGISLGTTGQYWRGDKSWQTLNKAAVGLSAVDNTADTDKAISTAAQAALNTKVTGAGLSLWVGTTAAYNALPSKSATTVYVLT